MINVGLINMRLYLLIIFYRVYGHQNVSESCSILQFFTCLFRWSWTQYQANAPQLMLHGVGVSVLQVVAAFNARSYMSRMSLDDSSYEMYEIYAL